MARFSFLLALSLCSSIHSTYARSLFRRQGCSPGSHAAAPDGGDAVCGNDGQFYNSAGQPIGALGQTGQPPPSDIPIVVQPTNPANPANPYSAPPAEGSTPPDYGNPAIVSQPGSQPSPTNQPGSQSSGPPVVVQQGAGAPPGYTTGFSTQDHEPVGQKSGCSTSCNTSSTIFSNDQIGPGGAYAAAINPAMFGSDVCATCGKCFDVRSAGFASSQGPGGPSEQPAGQISVWVVNSCTDCKLNQIDINNAPAGWDNPEIYFKEYPC